MTESTSVQPDQLPPAIREYLAAHEARDADTALRAFTPTALVVDNGTTYRGSEELRGFLSKAGAQFTYISTLVAAEHSDQVHWVVTKRLEGDFPGGVVVLRYSFTLDRDLISELVIAA